MKFAFRSPRSSVSVVLLAVLGLFSAACSDNGDDSDSGPATQDVVKNYAVMVSANYGEALSTAKDLRDAVDAFVESPSKSTLDDAKAAWLKCRNPYGESEAYRFYQGPIDNDDSDDDIPDGPEPLMNSWPLDESAIDYVLDGDGVVVSGGIINLSDDFPTIDSDVISAQNAKASETTITTGYHAIEFLLWGQDFNVDGPGDRPYTDYVVGDDATAENQERRALYLRVATDLLIANLTTVRDAWLEGEQNYRADFEAMDPKEALGKMLLGMGSLSGAELSGERMGAAFDHKDQEDEHSCFSDNTLKDLHNNATSVQNVLLGHYGDVSGPSIDDLLEAKDSKQAQKLRDKLQEALDDIDAIPAPFDQAILGDDDAPGRKEIQAAIQALQDFTDMLVQASKTLGIDLKFGG